MLPLLLLRRHERNKAHVLSQVVQVSVTLKKRLTGEALIGGYLQALHRFLWPIYQRVSGSDVIGRVMKVSVTAADLL